MIWALGWLGSAAGLLLAGHLGSRELLRRQAAVARRIIGDPFGEIAPQADRVYRRKLPGTPIELLLVGDSIAAGLGAERPKDTLGARLAKGLANRAGRPVRLRTIARVGAESRMLAPQLDRLAPTDRPDLAVIVVGGNDVTHRIPITESVEHLARAIDRLQARGARVVVGTCPDLGTLRPVPQPLRSLGSRRSRQLAAAQRRVALLRGAGAVSMARVVGPFFITNPEEMFSLDRFHPSSAGYRRTAKAMLPSLLAALGLSTDTLPSGHDQPRTGERTEPVERAERAAGSPAGRRVRPQPTGHTGGVRLEP